MKMKELKKYWSDVLRLKLLRTIESCNTKEQLITCSHWIQDINFKNLIPNKFGVTYYGCSIFQQMKIDEIIDCEVENLLDIIDLKLESYNDINPIGFKVGNSDI